MITEYSRVPISHQNISKRVNSYLNEPSVQFAIRKPCILDSSVSILRVYSKRKQFSSNDTQMGIPLCVITHVSTEHFNLATDVCVAESRRAHRVVSARSSWERWPTAQWENQLYAL